MSPSDAVALDLHEQPNNGDLMFSAREEGSASPLWDVRVRETPAVTGAPILLDSHAVGQLWLGAIRLDADPFAGKDGNNFAKNMTDLRLEGSVLMHVRRPAAIFVLDETES